MTTEHLSARLTPAGAENLTRVAEAMGVSTSAVIEVQARRAVQREIPAPGDDYQRWLDAQIDALVGPLTVANRRLTTGGKQAIDALSARWGSSQSDVVEYLVWFSANHWLAGEGERRVA